eukprot:TRINITY_DN21975_c0_g1_i1.p2 TRINITY_DN21975_c0_g1~~TRINITY_DN21975_c0_g1_i1.p2  ORF type:complete len:382 (+),score=118.83 TRINITY_DN21975_c0_g1_i1:85-1230(+)
MSPALLPSGAADAAPAFDKASMEVELEAADAAALAERGRRLVGSRRAMEEALLELNAEQKDLRDERERLVEEIGLFLSELKKLNIGAANLTEPELEEDGALDFLGRFWEQVRVRDTAVVVSDHIGELRKPCAAEGDVAIASSNLAKLSALSRGGAAAAAAEEALLGAQTAMEEARRHVSESFSGALSRLATATSGADAGADSGAGTFFSSWSWFGRGEGLASTRAGSQASTPPEVEEPTEADAEAGIEELELVADAAALPDVQASTSATEGEGLDADEASARAADAGASAATDAPAEGVIDASVLLEARISLGDGSVAVCRVAGAERCKDVAARFVQEHSLKASFKAPLTEFLKRTEAAAETFPVEVEADLLRIVEEHATA